MCELFVVPFVKHGDVIYKVKYSLFCGGISVLKIFNRQQHRLCKIGLLCLMNCKSMKVI